MNLKPEFVERMKLLLDEKDYGLFYKTLDKPYFNSIRCNTLKISADELKQKLEKKWKIKQPLKEHPEIMVIENHLEPGEIGKAPEHLLGYYYIQEISSMMPALVLKPDKEDNVLDLCASPGSKSTQIASMMENKGVFIANDLSLDRIRILSTNAQRCGATNIMITQHDGINLCARLSRIGFKFNKILVDAPCSGEGTLRLSPKTASMFNLNIIKKLSRTQKSLLSSALKILKVGGEIVYSTCTYAPEENEEVISYILDNFPVEIQEVKLPLKIREGIIEWQGKKYNETVVKCARIYPHDNNTEGFFIAKLKKVGEIGVGE